MTPTPPALADSQPVPVSFREQWAGFSNISQWPIEPSVATDLERSDWTPEEALRWYAAGKHYDTVPNGDGSSSARILDNGAVASNALKSLSRAYAEHKGDVALLETKADSEQDEGVSREQWIAQAMRVYLIAGDTEEQAHSCASYLWGELNMDDLDDPYEAALNDVEGRQSPPQADSPPAPIVGRMSPIADPQKCTARVRCANGLVTTESCITKAPLISNGESSDGERDYYICPDCRKDITINYREN